MRRAQVAILTAFLGNMFTAAVRAEYVPGSGLIASPHDFTNRTGQAYQSDPHASPCIFCHIEPRPSWGAQATVRIMRLVWNHKLSAQSFFWSSGMQTRGGTPLPRNLNTWIGPSGRCLSCHDGSVSIGDVRLGKHPAASFVGGAPYADGSGTVPNWVSGPAAPLFWERPGARAVDAAGRLTASCCVLGAAGDLNGTHPVGIPYPYGGVPGTYNGISSGPSVDLRSFEPAPANVKLFTVEGKTAVPGVRIGATGIECATCHDVHNEQARGPHLLRDSLDRLCSDCHR